MFKYLNIKTFYNLVCHKTLSKLAFSVRQYGSKMLMTSFCTAASHKIPGCYSLYCKILSSILKGEGPLNVYPTLTSCFTGNCISASNKAAHYIALQ